jgi:hypothetical protein
MPFSNYKNVKQVIQKYPVRIRKNRFLPDIPLELPEWFIENLNFALDNRTMFESEIFFCESFIFPFLQQTWKRHDQLKLWSHQELFYDDNLSGESDYLVAAWRDEVIDKPINTPLLAVVEAKKQDFEGGWAQCLAEMMACQKLNQAENITIYGIVSTGIIWEFGKLEKEVFTQHTLSYSVTEPQKIFGILDYLFAECEKQISDSAVPK